MYIPLRRVVLSLPTKDETPEEFEQTVMIGHAATGTPQKPIWILLKQETVSGSGISWDICKSAPHSRQIPCQHPTAQFFTGWMPFLPPNQQRQSTEGTPNVIHTNKKADKNSVKTIQTLRPP